MYTDHAHLYDRIYHWKNYAKEAEVVLGVLDRFGIPRRSRVLDAACGTGAHLVHLAEHYRVLGFDQAAPMIEEARAKLPDAELWTADLVDFTVDEPVDAAVCLFSAIGYLLDEPSLRASAAAFAAAVRPGGVLLVEPWLPPEQFHAGRPHLQLGDDDPDLKIVRASVSRVEGDVAVMDMHWMIARRDQGVQYFVDTHRLWLCPHDLLREIFEDAGFEAHLSTEGFMKDRGMLVGRRR